MKESIMTQRITSILEHYNRKPVCSTCHKLMKLGSKIISHPASGHRTHSNIRHKECWEKSQIA